MWVAAGDASFDVDAVVFDKDGTLIEVDATWHQVGELWIASCSNGDEIVAKRLRRKLGVGRTSLVVDGILASGTLDQIEAATRTVLGDIASSLLSKARVATLDAAQNAPVVPIGDVAGAIERLHQSGLVLAVASSDNGDMIVRHLAELGIHELISFVAAGDAEYPPKPHPASLDYLRTQTGIECHRMLVVGDSSTDLGMARRAGAAGIVAVVPSSGVSPIADEADSVLASIEGLVVLPG